MPERRKKMKDFVEMKRKEQEAFLMSPILNELKKLGGQATTKELRKAVVMNTEEIPENILSETKISSKGNSYNPFNYPFNFALANLEMADFVKRPNRGVIELTEKGRNFEQDSQNLASQVYKISLPKWKRHSEQNKREGQQVEDANENQAEETLEDSWRSKLLNALTNLSPTKFEFFCRALMRKMNIEVDEEVGVVSVGDGGIDGYGYLTTDDFRTARVAIQAKKWNPSNLVSSPEIDKFRGAMDKFRADYGIFITTSSFTREAKKASRTGTSVITLIDGDHLIDLIAKYKLFVEPVTVYQLGDFFNEKD